MVCTGEVKVDGVKTDRQGHPISPGKYVVKFLGSMKYQSSWVFEAGGELWVTVPGSGYLPLSSYADELVHNWARCL